MSAKQNLIEFNFTVHILCDELDTLDPNKTDKIGDIKFGNSRKDVKKNIRLRVMRITRDNLGSMGCVMLKQDAFTPTNPNRNLPKATHDGGAPGHIRGKGLVQLRLGVASYVDRKEKMLVDEFTELKEEIWTEVSTRLTGNEVLIDGSNDITGTMEFDEPTWGADAYNTVETMRKGNHTSEVKKSKNPHVNQAASSDFIGSPFGLDTQSVSSDGTDTGMLDTGGIDFENTDDPAQKVIDNYDAEAQVERFKQTTERFETDSVGVRKPTGDELRVITEAIHDRIMEFFDEDSGPTYFDEDQIPDEWANATCAGEGCHKDAEMWVEEEDTDALEQFRTKSQQIIKKRLSEDFGINSDGYEFQHSQTSNFFITENGDIMIRPEEIISWIISISQHTEPYCRKCHNDIRGPGHKDFVDNCVLTCVREGELSDSTPNPMREAANGNDTFEDTLPQINFERIDVDKAVDLDSEQFDSEYRSLTQQERNRIDKAVTEHLKKLGTRMSETNKQSDNVFNMLSKRDNQQRLMKQGHHECTQCESPISNDNDTLRSMKRHHIRPQSANSIPECMMQIRDLLERSVGVQAENAPVKVSKDGDRYLFIESFLAIIEELYMNVDTLAIYCEGCLTKRKDTDGDTAYTFENRENCDVDKNTNDGTGANDADNTRVFDMSYNTTTYDDEFEFLCVGCEDKTQQGNEDAIYTAKMSGGGHYSIDEEPVPIYTEALYNDGKPVGLCNECKKQAMMYIDASSLGIEEDDNPRDKVYKLFLQIFEKFG